MNASTKLRILVVDDEPDIADLLEDILCADYDVVVCYDGKEAVRKVDESDYDLIISDFYMPEMDGAALHSYVTQKNPDQKFLLMTAFNKKVLEKCNLTSDRVLLKPFSASDVFEKVRSLL